MQAYSRDRADLIRKVREQVELLHMLSATFDSCYRVAAYLAMSTQTGPAAARVIGPT
jgi:hypothetical protein